MKYVILVLVIFSSGLGVKSQSLTHAEIKKVAETMNEQIKGVDLGNGTVGRGCLGLGGKVIFQYDVSEDWYPTANMKEEIIQNLKTSGAAKMYYQKGIDVDFHYFKGNSLAKKVSVKSNEFSIYNFELGEYLTMKGHPKSKEVNLKLKVPVGWDVVEADRPNIVKKIMFETNIYMVMIKEFPAFISRNEASELFSDETYVSEFLADMISELKSSRVINHRVISLDRYPTLEFSAEGLIENSGVEMNVWMKYWIIPYEDRCVMLQSMSFDKKAYKELEPVFFSISNSVVFPDQYDN